MRRCAFPPRDLRIRAKGRPPPARSARRRTPSRGRDRRHAGEEGQQELRRSDWPSLIEGGACPYRAASPRGGRPGDASLYPVVTAPASRPGLVQAAVPAGGRAGTETASAVCGVPPWTIRRTFHRFGAEPRGRTGGRPPLNAGTFAASPASPPRLPDCRLLSDADRWENPDDSLPVMIFSWGARRDPVRALAGYGPRSGELSISPAGPTEGRPKKRFDPERSVLHAGEHGPCET